MKNDELQENNSDFVSRIFESVRIVRVRAFLAQNKNATDAEIADFQIELKKKLLPYLLGENE